MNRKTRIGWHLLVLAAVTLMVAAPSDAAKKFEAKPRKGQAGHFFVNHEGEDAHGLVVNLSNKAIVVTDASTGFAGPFQNIRGKGTKTIAFSNPRPTVTPATDDEDGFNLVFRSYKDGLKIQNYYWTDAQGKRLGKKQKP